VDSFPEKLPFYLLEEVARPSGRALAPSLKVGLPMPQAQNARNYITN